VTLLARIIRGQTLARSASEGNSLAVPRLRFGLVFRREYSGLRFLVLADLAVDLLGVGAEVGPGVGQVLLYCTRSEMRRS
jgi:hypothetical protein